ncbi:hypothetical protein GF356_11100 [candidate division GN15 bacterium]|nr:hypothetical protein [candidate division GN15 bacterium]
MKRSRWIALMMMLSLLCACFVSAPVLAEHPWDADANDGPNNGGPGQTTVDTSDTPTDPTINDGVERTNNASDSEDDLFAWLWSLMADFGRSMVFGGCSTGGASEATAGSPSGSGK